MKHFTQSALIFNADTTLFKQCLVPEFLQVHLTPLQLNLEGSKAKFWGCKITNCTGNIGTVNTEVCYQKSVWLYDCNMWSWHYALFCFCLHSLVSHQAQRESNETVMPHQEFQKERKCNLGRKPFQTRSYEPFFSLIWYVPDIKLHLVYISNIASLKLIT